MEWVMILQPTSSKTIVKKWVAPSKNLKGHLDQRVINRLLGCTSNDQRVESLRWGKEKHHSRQLTTRTCKTPTPSSNCNSRTTTRNLQSQSQALITNKMQEGVPLIKLIEITKLAVANSRLSRRKQFLTLALIFTRRRGLIRRSPCKSSHHPQYKLQHSPISTKNKSIIKDKGLIMVVNLGAILDDLRKGSWLITSSRIAAIKPSISNKSLKRQS